MERFPPNGKSTRVTPLFKGGKSTNMDNYRPISVLCISSKILERVIHSQLYRFLEETKVLSPYQCGFRKDYSTEFATISFTDSIRRSMDQGMMTGAVFIDLKKAF
jgi:sarcosine oxidase/L-pipecolate oxidase